MAATTKNRVSKGRPTGGQFAPTRMPEQGSATLGTSGNPCSDCGQMTQRTSGLCKRCDPARKRASTSHRETRHTVSYDTNAGSVPAGEIVQCSFQFVPQLRSGGFMVNDDGTNVTRPCKNAVRAPGERCHRHGGETSTSLGRTLSKAMAEAGRGECFPLSEDHWLQADERIAAAQGRLMDIISTDTTALAAMSRQIRNFRKEHGAGRFRPSNQMLILLQYAQTLEVDDGSDVDIFERAAELASEPHHTKEGWAKLGREINDGATGVAVIWAAPRTRRLPAAEAAETGNEHDAEGAEPEREPSTYLTMATGGHIQYRLGDTNGEPFEVPPADMIDAFVPKSVGNPSAATDALTNFGRAHGFNIKFTDTKPSSGAYGYWQSSTSEIVVWNGVAGGDKAAVFHVLAHEMGHAWMGHSTNDGAEINTPDKEVAAEAFAAMVCREFGMDSGELSATYIDGYRAAGGVNMESSGLGPIVTALSSFDDFMTQFEAEEGA